MPTKSASSKSKRISSRARHKIVRKKRENKRDLKKAAKAMRKSGLRIRPKRQREKAKLALRLSSKDPNKERVLNSLLRSRERIKLTKQQRRKAHMDQKAAAAAAGDSDQDGDDDGVQNEQQEGEEADDGRQDAAWMHPISAAQLEQRERAARKEEHQARAEAERQRGVRRYLAFPPGQQGSGDPAVQLRKIISVMQNEVPVFIITLDARCALESMPWAVLDDIVATAVAQDAAASSSDADNDNDGGQQQQQTAMNPTMVEGAKARHIFFVFTRADLVAADALVQGATAVAQAVTERYLEQEPAVERLVSFSCAAAAPAASSQSIVYLIKALNQKVQEVVAVRKQLNALYAAQQQQQQPDAEPLFAKKEIHKVVFCVYGYPNTGRTSLCAALAKRAGESTCRIVYPGNINEVVQVSRPGDSNNNNNNNNNNARRRFRFDEAKPITLLCPADSSAMQAAPIRAGDILFHRHATPERMSEPELPAMRFLDALPRKDFETACRAFGQPGCTDGRHLVTSIGRCVRREHGFYTPHSDEAMVSSSIGQGLFASSIEGVAQPSLRVFHQVSAQRRDGSNATRIGARVFLHELCRGEWGLRWCANTVPEAVRRSSQDVAACLGRVFDTPPSALRRGRAAAGDDDDADAEEEEHDSKASAEERRNRTFIERGIKNVISLQQIAQTMPLAEALTASRGLALPGELFTPQVDMNIADTEHIFDPEDSSDEDDDDDDVDALMDEGGFGDYDSDYERFLLGGEDEEGDEDFDSADFDDDDDDDDDDMVSGSDASSGGMFTDSKAAQKAWGDARRATQQQQQQQKQLLPDNYDDLEDFDEESESTDFGFVTGKKDFWRSAAVDSDDMSDSDDVEDDEEEGDFDFDDSSDDGSNGPSRVEVLESSDDE